MFPGAFRAFMPPGPWPRGASRVRARGHARRAAWVAVTFVLSLAAGVRAGAEAAPDPVAVQRAALEAARVDAVDALSPARYADAVEALEAAERDRARGRDPSKVAAQVDESVAALAEAARLASITRQALPGFVDARARAGRAKAHQWAPQAWAKGATRFAEAAQRAERGDIEAARSRAAEAEALLLAAELEAIQNEALAPARTQIAAATAAKVDDYAPRTLADARRLVEQAAQEIARNRYDMVVPGELAQKAEYQARHARMLAETIQPLLAAEREAHALESLLLDWEAPLLALAGDLGVTPRFDQGYLRPLDDLQKRARELRAERDRLRADASAQAQALADARAALARAEVKLRFFEGTVVSASTGPDGAAAGGVQAVAAGEAPSAAASAAPAASASAAPVASASVKAPPDHGTPVTESAPVATAAVANAAASTAEAAAAAAPLAAAAPALAPPLVPAPVAGAPVASVPAPVNAAAPAVTAPAMLSLAAAFPADEAVLAQRGDYQTLTLTGVHFAAGASSPDAASRPVLDKACTALSRIADATFMVEGHVDPSGNDDADLSLSQDRANAVRAHLVQRCGIRQERVLSMGYAASVPVAANDTAEGRAANRRIVIEIQVPK